MRKRCLKGTGGRRRATRYPGALGEISNSRYSLTLIDSVHTCYMHIDFIT